MNFAMLKKLNSILNIVIGICIGIFIGYGISVFWDYKTHPDLYLVRSAPWYTGILVHGVVTIAILIALMIIKLIIRLRH